jgi:hypothetical protein
MTPPPLPPLRPRAATEVVDAAIQLVRGHYGHLLQLAALGTIPSLALVLVQALVAPGAAIPADPTKVGPVAGVLVASLLVSTIFGLATQGALSWSGLAALCGATLPSVAESFRVGFRRLPTLVVAVVLVGLGALLPLIPITLVAVLGGEALRIGAIGAAVLGLTVIVVALVLAVASYGLLALVTSLVVLEGLGPVAAIGRAFRLARGAWLRIAGVWTVAIVLFLAVFGAVFGLAALLGNDDVASALATVLAIPAIPIFGMVALVQYADLRTRREGADLEAALGGLATGDGAPTFPA